MRSARSVFHDSSAAAIACRVATAILTAAICIFVRTESIGHAAIGAENMAAVGRRILPPGTLPNDKRLGPLKDLNGYFPFAPPETAEAWQKRAENVRRRILIATGLWPMPPRGPVEAVVHGKVDRGEYTVERVYLESFPGHYVTGSLYRPKNKPGKLPAVLSPHGHFSNGRFHDHGPDEIRRQIDSRAERFEVGGRYPLQARCAQLARFGCLVFQYDMVGYADSIQIPSAVAHGHSAPRPELESTETWGYFTCQAELRMQNIMGLQTFNSIRALDWLSSLPDVDPKRIAVTGASGGGTQTMILCAIDDRPAVSFPAVMVSTAMQGGCTCENACCLRVGTGNVEFAGLFAPKPLGMTAADDWTKEIATKGLPELKQLYTMLGVPELVNAWPLVRFPHNYNYVSRGAMYGWLSKHLGLVTDKPIEEQDYQPLSRDELTVWNDEHPRPEGGVEYETSLLRRLAKTSDEQLAEFTPRDSRSLAEFRRVVGGANKTTIGDGGVFSQAVEHREIAMLDRGRYGESHGLLRSPATGGELPNIILLPKNSNQGIVVWISGKGKASLFARADRPRDEVARLLDAGIAVAGVDLLYQGEFLADDKSPAETRRVDNNRDFAGYTFGYNKTLFAHRVHDILTLLAYIDTHEHQPKEVHLVGIEGGGVLAAAASAMAGDRVDRVAVDTQGFRFQQLSSCGDPNFVPGAVKYGDVPGLLSLSAPRPLWFAGESGLTHDLVTSSYRAAGASERLHLTAVAGESVPSEAVDWIIDSD